MFGRKKVKEEQAARVKSSQEPYVVQQQQGAEAASSSRAGTPSVQRHAGNSYGAQDSGLHSSHRMVSAEEYQRLKELLEAKCDEVDDLSNNLKLAKDSLRQVDNMCYRIVFFVCVLILYMPVGIYLRSWTRQTRSSPRPRKRMLLSSVKTRTLDNPSAACRTWQTRSWTWRVNWKRGF